jgi:hypothetical protein
MNIQLTSIDVELASMHRLVFTALTSIRDCCTGTVVVQAALDASHAVSHMSRTLSRRLYVAMRQ